MPRYKKPRTYYKPCALVLMCCFIPYLLMLLFSFSPSNGLDNNIVTVRKLWRNDPQSCPTKVYKDGSKVNIIIDPPSDAPHFAFGFYNNRNFDDSFLLSVFLHYDKLDTGFPQVVWSAKRGNPVKENATLEFNPDGSLVLKEADGTFVWSTNTAGRFNVRLELTDAGNLALFDSSNNAIWQSFDYPTDTLVLGQKMVDGQKLISCASTENWSEGLFQFSFKSTSSSSLDYKQSASLDAVIYPNGPMGAYYHRDAAAISYNNESMYVRYRNGSLSIYISNAEPEKPVEEIPIPRASPVQFMKLDFDGHLRVYDWKFKWITVGDVYNISKCKYPLACGKYGVCSQGKCKCPQETINGTPVFQLINKAQQDLGCYETTPLSCGASEYHHLLNLTNVYSYDIGLNPMGTDIEGCRQACLKNCSCRGATFLYGLNSSEPKGSCSILSDIKSLHNLEDNIFEFKVLTLLKVQTNSSRGGDYSTPSSSSSEAWIWLSTFGSLFFILLFAITVLNLKMMNAAAEKHEKSLQFLPGSLMSFSYDDLKDATQNFSNKLGEGASGSVYEGTLINGTKVAVKRLDGQGRQVKASFVAEVETIGSIHHVNLVKLLGFCADETNHMLVYEYLCNGSLDEWIFSPEKASILNWEKRRQIIIHIARGVAYLHEECSPRIFHLDIKPQNILLDDKFNAKVSDFGLSKLINKDQSKVMTTMRGTPGYMAPEWLSFAITEKVDVYSFGIVMMEILCGRRNVDFCETEECIPLISLLGNKTDDDGLYNMIDSNCDDMSSHSTEILGMMKLVLWCVHSNCRRRPSMSVLVKALDSLINVEGNLNNTLLSSLPSPYSVGVVLCSPMLPSVLSGPR